MSAIGSLFYTGLSALEKSPFGFALAQEVLGSNVPKSVVTQTHDEFVDVAAGQFGGTVAFFGSGWGLDKLLNWAFKRSAHVDFHAIAEKATPIAQMANRDLWAVAGKSAAIFAIQGALYWAVPFARNILTARRTGSGNFKDVIDKSQRPLTPQEKEAKVNEANKTIAYCKKMIAKIVGGGTLVALASLGMAALGMQRGWGIGKNLGQWGNKLLETFALAHGGIHNYPKWSQFLFIAVASYAGWIHAVREKMELKEQLLQFGGFLFGWFGPPAWAKSHFNGKFSALLEKHLTKDNAKTLYDKVMGANWNGTPGNSLSIGAVEKHLANHPNILKEAQALCRKQTGVGLLVSAVLLGAIPQLINWQLRKGRLTENNALTAVPLPKQPLPEAPLKLKAQQHFNAFAQAYR